MTVSVSADTAADGNGIGNTAASETFAVDTKAPGFQSAAVTGNTLVLTYDEDLDAGSPPAASAYTVTAGATSAALTTAALAGADPVTVSAKTVTLTLATAVATGATVQLSYTVPGSGSKLQDTLGNAAGNLTDRPVTNRTLPTVAIATPNGAAGGFLYEAEAATDELQYKWMLTRDGLPDDPLTVNLSVTETDGDFLGVEESAMQPVTFAAGDATVSYTPITFDTTDEPHGTVTVEVADGADYDVHATAASATLVVRDHDGMLLEVSVDATVTAPEGMPAVFGDRAENTDGTLTEAGHLDRLFRFTEVAVTASTADGTATAGSDDTGLTDEALALGTFEAVSGGGRWVGEVSVDTLDDSADEGSEDFTVTLSLPKDTNSRIVLSATVATGTVTIGDNDAPTVVRLTGTDERVHGCDIDAGQERLRGGGDDGPPRGLRRGHRHGHPDVRLHGPGRRRVDRPAVRVDQRPGPEQRHDKSRGGRLGRGADAAGAERPGVAGGE